jgi:UDPglucose 6-dehydrogenase
MANGKKPLIGFIGQGWIGKAYADNFEDRGFEVVRYALEKQYVKNKDKIKDCDIVFIAVWTPTTPKGFDSSVIESVLPLVGKGKTAVLKSTIVPGTTELLQKKFADIVLLYGPEFLSVASHLHDAAHPFVNLMGMPVSDAKHFNAAERVMKILPKAPYSDVCKSVEAEIFKYTHNASGYTQVILFNLMYDLAQKLGANWDVVHKAVLADPLIAKRYANPVHKSGRGAGAGERTRAFPRQRGRTLAPLLCSAFLSLYVRVSPPVRCAIRAHEPRIRLPWRHFLAAMAKARGALVRAQERDTPALACRDARRCYLHRFSREHSTAGPQSARDGTRHRYRALRSARPHPFRFPACAYSWPHRRVKGFA